ncbi:maleamate amidohydrolase [Microdochium nivale]|nr:maleamate amidohydrolase [Microdochium nivale]
MADTMIAEYKASGFGNVMGWGAKPVLLMVDVCRAYWTAGSPLSTLSHEPSAAAPAVMRRLVAAARASGVPVIWTAVEYTHPEMADAGLFWLKSKSLAAFNVADGRGLGGWLEGLEPERGDLVVKKKYASAFFGTSLSSDLAVLGADTVVLCGVSTSGCVRASTLDAMQYGYRPMVVGSACGDRSDEIQNSNLFDLNAKYADVVTEADAVEHLKAGWPKA